VRDVIADGTTEDRLRRPRRVRKPDEETPTETKVETEVAAETPAEGTTDEPPVEDKATPVLEVVEEEPPTRTYDQFLASKQKLEADLAIQRREAQNDETQFKAVKVIAKNEEKNPYIIPSAEEKEKAKKVKKDKAKHISLDEFTATANGTRGGFRGRGGRGGRGRAGDARSLAVTESNFPALAPKEKK
jgi:hypothetical protein